MRNRNYENITILYGNIYMIYIYIVTMFQIEHWDQSASTIKQLLWTRTDISTWLLKVPGIVLSFVGALSSKEQFKTNVLGFPHSFSFF